MQNFLALTRTEQQELLAIRGNVLISSSQGNTTTTFYSLNDFFVKVSKDNEGNLTIEALSNLDNLKLHDANH